MRLMLDACMVPEVMHTAWQLLLLSLVLLAVSSLFILQLVFHLQDFPWPTCAEDVEIALVQMSKEMAAWASLLRGEKITQNIPRARKKARMKFEKALNNYISRKKIVPRPVYAE